MARFWVGGTGNWSDTAHWSDTSGGAGGFAVPTALDNVTFDAASNATAYTVTLDATGGTKLCLDISFSAPGTSGNVTWAGSTALTVSGSFTLYSGLIRTYNGTLTLNATTTGKTVTLAGTVLVGMTLNGTGGEWIFQDTFAAQALTLTAGTLDTNSRAVNISSFASSNTNVRRLKLGSSVITMSSNGNPLIVNGASLTIDANTATWIVNNNGGVFDLGGYAFYNLTFANVASYLLYTCNGGGTVSNNLTCTGLNANTTRLLIASSAFGTARIFTCNGTVALTNVDLQDITIAGSAAPASGTSVGDCGGNSGVTFTTPATVTWRTDSGNLSDPTKWDTGKMPLCQDTILFDASSFTTGGRVVTCTPNTLRLPSLNFSTATNTPTLALTAASANDLALYGSLNLTGALKTGTGALRVFGRTSSAFTITSNGQAFGSGAVEFNFMGSGSIALQDAFSTTGVITLFNGTLNTNNQTIQSLSFSSNTGLANAITLGSTVWTLTGTGTVWQVNVTTITPGTSTIKITDTSATSKTFQGTGKTYNNLWLAGGGSGIFIIQSSNTFNQLKGDTPTAAATLQLTAATTQTIADWQLAGTSGHVWTITSVTAATHFLRFTGSVPITTDFLDISRSTATPGYKWFAGTHSVNSGNNSGWIFGVPGANKPQEIAIH